MTDPSQLMPGPELDAIIAEILGWKPECLCGDDPNHVIVCLDGSNNANECCHLAEGGTWATCPSKLTEEFHLSTDYAANADVKRCLVEKTPSDLDGDKCDFVVACGTRGTQVYFKSGRTPYTCWFLDVSVEETNSDPIAAEMLAVCRFAVRVARELKHLEQKP